MMNAAIPQLPFDPIRATDRLVKLRDVERELARYFHAESRPSRNTIIGWIEEGTLLGLQLGSGNNYYVLESSLERFKERFVRIATDLAA